MVPILEPFCLSIDTHFTPSQSRWRAEVEPMSVLISYEDWSVCGAIVNYWLKWLSSFKQQSIESKEEGVCDISLTCVRGCV